MMFERYPESRGLEPRAVFVLVPFQVDRTKSFNHHESRLLSNPIPMVVSRFRKRKRISDQSEETPPSLSEQQETVQEHHIRLLGQALFPIHQRSNETGRCRQ